MFCKYCGHQMPNYVGRCPSCGKNVRDDEPSYDIETSHTPPKTQKPSKIFSPKGQWVVLGLLVVIIATVILLAAGSGSTSEGPKTSAEKPKPKPITIEEYTQKWIDELKGEVAKWARTRPEIVTAIENKHGTVTVDAVNLKSVKVNTYDDSRFINKDLGNVESIKLVIRFWWDGIIHQDGHTDIAFILVPKGEDDYECRKCWVEDTDALVNFDDPEFWAGVATLLLL